MDSSVSQDGQSTSVSVQQSLPVTESSSPGVYERSHLAHLCSECMLLFQVILKNLRANNDFQPEQWKLIEISLKRSYGRMKIWSDENGVADGGLDATLAASRDLQHDTLKYVVSISETLTESKPAHDPCNVLLGQLRLTKSSGLIEFIKIDLGETGLESISRLRSLTAVVMEGDSDGSSDPGFSDCSSDSIYSVLEDLKVDTTCLLDLEPLLCSPGDISAYGTDVAATFEQLRKSLNHGSIPQAQRVDTAGIFAVWIVQRPVPNSMGTPGYGENDRASDLNWVFEYLLQLPSSISRCFYLGVLGMHFYSAYFQHEDTVLLQKAEMALKVATQLPDAPSTPTLGSVESSSLPVVTGLLADHEASLVASRTLHLHTLGSIKHRLYNVSGDLRYLEEAKKLLEGSWADTADGSGDNMAAGLKLVKCYQSLFARIGDLALLQKGMLVLDKVLQYPQYRTTALIFQCDLRLRLWESEHDPILLHKAIEVAETIRSEVDHDQAPTHLGTLMNLYLELWGISNDIKDLEKAVEAAHDALVLADSMPIGSEISETDKLIAQARSHAEYGRCILMRYQYTQDHAFLYQAVRVATKSIPLSQRLGKRDPNALFHQLQLAALRCQLSLQSGEARGLAESIEWIQQELSTAKTASRRLTLQSALLECIGARYCGDAERCEADLQEVMRLGYEIGKVTKVSRLAQTFVAIYKRNDNLEVLNQAIDLNPGEMGHDLLILAESLLARSQHLHGQGWSEDAEAALEYLKRYISGEMISSMTFIIATSLLSHSIFISSGKLEMSFLASATKKAVQELPNGFSLALTREDIKKNLGFCVGLVTTAAASALAAGHGADEALELLEGGRGILATYLLDSRIDRLLSGSSELGEAENSPASLLKDKLAELELAVRSDGVIAPEQRRNVGRAYELKLEIEGILKQLKLSEGQVSPLFRPPKAAEMKDGVCDGAIVVVNAGFRGDAIIVYKHETRSLPLPLLTQDGVEWALQCLTLLRQRRGSPRLRKLRGLLSRFLLIWIWKVAVEPILDDLGFTGTPSPGESWPRVWWVLTGNLSQLPFHAAGIHTPGSTSSALDRVISSYSSSINALLFTRKNLCNKKESRSNRHSMVVVPISEARNLRDLPFVDQEASTIKAIFEHDQSIIVNPLTEPRKEDVLESLSTCDIFHFAGHGASFIDDPDRGCLYLKDGKDDPLTVRDVLNLNLRHRAPWLAYLSACSTGTNQPNALRDEGVHLVAAYQLAGFQHVVGSFWEVSDSRSEIVARSFYRHLKRTGIGEGNGVALALHLAIQELRGHKCQAVRPPDEGTATPDPGDQFATTPADAQILEVNEVESLDDDGGGDDADLDEVLNVLRGGAAPGCTQDEWDELRGDFEDESRDAGWVERQGSSGGRTRSDPMFWATYFHVGL